MGRLILKRVHTAHLSRHYGVEHTMIHAPAES
jgi:hypothetical protein